MYGMNIDLPFQHHIWSYPALLVVSLLSLIIIAVYGRRKKIF
jgi:Mg2+ and Co2+ transporter CorA